MRAKNQENVRKLVVIIAMDELANQQRHTFPTPLARTGAMLSLSTTAFTLGFFSFAPSSLAVFAFFLIVFSPSALSSPASPSFFFAGFRFFSGFCGGAAIFPSAISLFSCS
jgi:hypothetical protein